MLREKARKQEDERASDRAKQVVYPGPPGDAAARRRWEMEQAEAADLEAAMDSLAAPSAPTAPPPPPGADVAAYVDAMPLSDAASFKVRAGVFQCVHSVGGAAFSIVGGRASDLHRLFASSEASMIALPSII